MPYSTTPPTNEYRPSDEIPQNAKHRPLFALPYESFDGNYIGATDMRYISVGLAQWNVGETSVKMMRHPDAVWSRQSEELPPHRAIDMVSFLVKVLFDTQNDQVLIPKETYINQKSEITITREERTYREKNYYSQYINKHEQLLKDRAKALYHVLDKLIIDGKI